MKFGYEFWYNVATYCNEAWRGKFTEREVAKYAYDYKVEWDATVSQGKITHVIDTLLTQLIEDVVEGSEEAKGFAGKICGEILRRDIDTMP